MIYTVAAESSALLKIKRSQFIGSVFPLADSDELGRRLKTLKKSNPKARHFCWAYRLQQNGQISENQSDAGEPGGTAGLPILQALQSANLVQCGTVVIRIFGGVKLGKRGLIDAYGQTAAESIAAAKIIPWEEKIQLILRGQLPNYGEYLRLLTSFRGSILADDSDAELVWTVELPEINGDDFRIAVRDRLNGSAQRK